LVLYEETFAHGVADPSKPGFGSRFEPLGGRHIEQTAPPG
jgi:hypothetical protein